MVKICIVSYYGLSESLGAAADSLKKYNHEVYDFPLFKYIHDTHDKRDNYVDLFVDFIKKEKIQVILWWFIGIATDKFKEIQNRTGVRYIFYNWDDPSNWYVSDMAGKASCFEAVYISSKYSLEKYLSCGSKNAYYLLPGFSNEIHQPQKFNLDEYTKYSCDISFCCTNLYDGPQYNDQYFPRKQLLDLVYKGSKEHKYKFNIYGPDFLKNYYPDSYKGFIKYHDLSKLFTYSKINICTHMIQSADEYINERCILIGASGGLLLVDPVKGIENIFDIDNEIILINKNDCMNQILNILQTYDNYLNRRLALRDKCLKKYEYEHWAKYIHDTFLVQFN